MRSLEDERRELPRGKSLWREGPRVLEYVQGVNAVDSIVIERTVSLMDSSPNRHLTERLDLTAPQAREVVAILSAWLLQQEDEEA